MERDIYNGQKEISAVFDWIGVDLMMLNHTQLQRQFCWKNNTFFELNKDDKLWAYNCQASEEFRLTNMEQLRDPILCTLMMVGMYDWDGVDAHLHQSTQAIQYSSAVASRLIHWIMDLETKVSLKSCLIESFLNRLYSAITWKGTSIMGETLGVRGPGTSDYMLRTLRSLVKFNWLLISNNILGTFQM